MDAEDSLKVYGNFQFLVYVGSTELKFSKVSGIEAGVEIEDISLGGINDEAYYAVSPKRKPGVLTLERGITLLEDTKSWKPGMYIPGPIQVFVMSGSKARSYISSYHMAAGVITKWEINPLNALGSEILIDTFQITHSGVVRQ